LNRYWRTLFPGHEADRLSPSIIEVKNLCTVTSAPPHDSVAGTGSKPIIIIIIIIIIDVVGLFLVRQNVIFQWKDHF